MAVQTTRLLIRCVLYPQLKQHTTWRPFKKLPFFLSGLSPSSLTDSQVGGYRVLWARGQGERRTQHWANSKHVFLFPAIVTVFWYVLLYYYTAAVDPLTLEIRVSSNLLTRLQGWFEYLGMCTCWLCAERGFYWLTSKARCQCGSKLHLDLTRFCKDVFLLQDLMNRDKQDKIPSMQVSFIDAICTQLYEVKLWHDLIRLY